MMRLLLLYFLALEVVYGGKIPLKRQTQIQSNKNAKLIAYSLSSFDQQNPLVIRTVIPDALKLAETDFKSYDASVAVQQDKTNYEPANFLKSYQTNPHLSLPAWTKSLQFTSLDNSRISDLSSTLLNTNEQNGHLLTTPKDVESSGYTIEKVPEIASYTKQGPLSSSDIPSLAELIRIFAKVEQTSKPATTAVNSNLVSRGGSDKKIKFKSETSSHPTISSRLYNIYNISTVIKGESINNTTNSIQKVEPTENSPNSALNTIATVGPLVEIQNTSQEIRYEVPINKMLEIPGSTEYSKIENIDIRSGNDDLLDNNETEEKQLDIDPVKINDDDIDKTFIIELDTEEEHTDSDFNSSNSVTEKYLLDYGEKGSEKDVEDSTGFNNDLEDVQSTTEIEAQNE